MAVTISDIAKECGVSVTTVSRVINKTKPVSLELTNKINEAVKHHNFTPNTVARSLAMSKTYTIGIIISDITNNVFGEILKGINAVCHREGYIIMVLESQGELENERKLLNSLQERCVDGVLFAGKSIQQEMVDFLLAKKYPVGLIMQESIEDKIQIDTTILDNYKATYDEVNFLIKNGHRNIAYIGGPCFDYSSGKLRIEGYKQALQDAEILIDDDYIIRADFTFACGYNGMKKIYEESEVTPTAVVMGNDTMAVGAIRFLEHVNVHVPNDISIMGFDDIDIASYFKPELSTVRVSYYDEGYIAAEKLIQRINDEESEPQVTRVPHKVIKRNSTKNIGAKN